jgi:hypothetical protein
MMEIEFKRDLNQFHDIQKSQDDMDKALAAAHAKSPPWTETMARVVTKPPNQQNARKEVSPWRRHHPHFTRHCFHCHCQVMVREWQRGRSDRLHHKRGNQPRKPGLSCCHCHQIPLTVQN